MSVNSNTELYILYLHILYATVFIALEKRLWNTVINANTDQDSYTGKEGTISTLDEPV